MTETEVEIERTVTDTETFIKCDGCDTEIEDVEEAVTFSNDAPDVADIHFHVECAADVGVITTPPEMRYKESTWATLVLDPIDIGVGVFGIVMFLLGVASILTSGLTILSLGLVVGGFVALHLAWSVGRSNRESVVKEASKNRKNWAKGVAHAYQRQGMTRRADVDSIARMIRTDERFPDMTRDQSRKLARSHVDGDDKAKVRTIQEVMKMSPAQAVKEFGDAGMEAVDRTLYEREQERKDKIE